MGTDPNTWITTPGSTALPQEPIVPARAMAPPAARRSGGVVQGTGRTGRAGRGPHLARLRSSIAPGGRLDLDPAAFSVVHAAAITGVKVDTAIQVTLTSGTFTSTAGQLCFVVGMVYASTATWDATTPMADSKGNTWTQLGSELVSTAPNNQRTRVYWSILNSAGTSHTISMKASANTQMCMVAELFSTTDTATVVDVSSTFEIVNAAPSAAWRATPITPTKHGTALIGWCSTDNSDTLTADSGYAKGSSVEGGGWYGAGIEWAIQPAIDAFAPRWTLSASDHGFVGAVAILPTPSVSTTPITCADTCGFGATDAISDITSTLTAVETCVLGLAEGISTIALAASETCALGTTESSTLSITLTAQETAFVSAVEGILTIALSASDACAVPIIEAAVPTVTIAVADAITLGATDVTSALSVTLTAVETLALGLSAVASLSTTMTAADTLTLPVQELVTITIPFSITETLALPLNESATVTVTLSVTDTLACRATEIGTVIPITITHDLAITALSNANSATCTTAAFTSLAGDVIVATIAYWANGGTITFTSFADSKGNSWTQLGPEYQQGNRTVRLYWTAMPLDGTQSGTGHTLTLTVSTATAAGLAIAADMFGGLDMTTQPDGAIPAVVQVTVAANPLGPTSVFTQTATQVLVLSAAVTDAPGAVYTLGADTAHDFLIGSETTVSAPFWVIGQQYKIVTGHSTHAALWNAGYADTGTLTIVGLQAAPSTTFIATAETLKAGATEASASISETTTAADSLTLGLIDATPVQALTVTDSVTLGANDLATVSALVSSADACALPTADVFQFVSVTLSMVETLALPAVDIASVFVTLSTLDTVPVIQTDALALSVTVTISEALSVQASDTALLSVTIPLVDVVLLTQTDISTLTTTATSSDTSAVLLTEVASVSITDLATPIAATDTLAVITTEVIRPLEWFLTVPDALALQATDTSAQSTGTVTTIDLLPIQLSEIIDRQILFGQFDLSVTDTFAYAGDEAIVEFASPFTQGKDRVGVQGTELISELREILVYACADQMGLSVSEVSGPPKDVTERPVWDGFIDLEPALTLSPTRFRLDRPNPDETRGGVW